MATIKHLEKLKDSTYFKKRGLPCIVREMRDAPSNTVIAMHDHEFSELVIVASGNLQHIHASETTRLAAGDFFVIHPGERHGYAELAPGTVVYNLLYHCDRPSPLLMLGDLPLMSILFPHNPTDIHASTLGHIPHRNIPSLIRLIHAIRHEEQSCNSLSHAICTSLFSTIVLYLSRAMQPMTAEPVNPIQKEIDFILQNLEKKIKLKDLCLLSGRSISTLSRLFKKTVGKSPGDYIIALRVAKARILLSQNEHPLDEIASRTGFCGAGHLARTLRTYHLRQGRPVP